MVWYVIACQVGNILLLNIKDCIGGGYYLDTPPDYIWNISKTSFELLVKFAFYKSEH